MKTKFWIPAILAATTFSAGAFAHGNDRDQDRRYNRWDQQRYERRIVHMPPPPVRAQPRVVYAQPVVYRPAPVYHVAPPMPPMPHNPQRVVGQAIGAVAGGFVGHQVGNGHIAPTIIGAVIGGVIGDQFAR